MRLPVCRGVPSAHPCACVAITLVLAARVSHCVDAGARDASSRRRNRLLAVLSQPKVTRKKSATLAGGVVPCALGAVLWVPRGGLWRSGALLFSFFFCGGVLLCVLCLFRGGGVALPRGCGRLVRPRALSVSGRVARCLRSARVGRRWCLVRRSRRLRVRSGLRLLCCRGGRLLVRGCAVLGGLGPRWRCARFLRCRSRRCCRRRRGRACCLRCGGRVFLRGGGILPGWVLVVRADSGCAVVGGAFRCRGASLFFYAATTDRN